MSAPAHSRRSFECSLQGAIALLATDAPTRKAAETKLILERKLRPTEEERQAKLAELAADAFARREANRARVETTKAIRTERDAMAKDEVQAERRRAKADRALANALLPNKPSARPSSPFGGMFGSGPNVDPELAELEGVVNEAREAGNGFASGALAERLRVAEVRLSEMRAERGIGGGGGIMGSSPVATSRNSHRSPSPMKESPIERTMRRQKLAAKMGRK